MKANHHGTANCNGAAFVQRLSPNTVVVDAWRDIHPSPETAKRFVAANSHCNIFTTNLTSDNRQRLGGDLLARMPSTQGHIVIRVEPRGDRYTVYALDDSNERYSVIGVHGPYHSKGRHRHG